LRVMRNLSDSVKSERSMNRPKPCIVTRTGFSAEKKGALPPCCNACDCLNDKLDWLDTRQVGPQREFGQLIAQALALPDRAAPDADALVVVEAE